MDEKIPVRRYAVATSAGPEIANLQLASWHQAVQLYREYAEQSFGADGGIDPNAFEIATVAVILAGTSVTQLLGQNADPSGIRVPSPVNMLRDLVDSDPDGLRLLSDYSKCNRLYDDLRHFGSHKYEHVDSIDPPSFAHFFTVCQDVWLYVLKAKFGRQKGADEEIDWHLSYQFDVEDE